MLLYTIILTFILSCACFSVTVIGNYYSKKIRISWWYIAGICLFILFFILLFTYTGISCDDLISNEWRK
jgi:hypothetical protein